MLKKNTLAIAVAMGLGSATTQAVTFNMTYMDFLGTDVDNPNVTGTVDTVGGGSGNFNSGGTPFFGHEWTATVAATFETTGAGTWNFSGVTGASSTGSYNFSLGAGQVAMGLLFNWNNNAGIPTLNIVNADGTGVDIDGDGVLGTQWVAGCCAGTPIGFAGTVVTTVPVPATVWLFGSGLLGLASMARRKKAV